jgi:hypothetical protein
MGARCDAQRPQPLSMRCREAHFPSLTCKLEWMLNIQGSTSKGRNPSPDRRQGCRKKNSARIKAGKNLSGRTAKNTRPKNCGHFQISGQNHGGKKSAVTHWHFKTGLFKSAWRDSNPRPLAPQASALIQAALHAVSARPPRPLRSIVM